LRIELLHFFIPLAVGVAVAWFRLAYAEYFAAYGGKKTLFTFASAFIVCAILYYALTQLDSLALLIASSCLPVLFTAPLCFYRIQSPRNPSKRYFNPSIRHFWKLALLVCLFSVLFDITEAYLISDKAPFFSSSYAQGFLIVGLASLCIFLVLVKKRVSGERFFFIAMIISMLVGTSAFFLSQAVSDASLLLTILIIGRYGFVALFQAAAASIAKARNIQGVLIFAVVLCFQRFGNSIGELIGQGIVGVEGHSVIAFAIVSVIILVTLTIAVVVLSLKDNQAFLGRLQGRFTHTDSGERQVPAIHSDSPVVARVEKRGAEHGLTSREVEILALIVEGKSTAGICQDLHISASTAKTHTQHIFQKLGVHSRKEILSMFETLE
jgi:DNA-binding CsgD family transcriptional regulator